ncbi:hypothetical protein CDD81_6339 [Ophiocordyceps australis]|uniref:Peptidase S54 rhomboid domain-containing protein n=1 Tax=Ophiocordyceps australis TaxID=1399860 RepID=A0A2C5XUL7_9HYPO|nr:hypothetical protein CDD81_6339 [Ophiocordyceps australis]
MPGIRDLNASSFWIFIQRLPLVTRIIILLITLCWMVGLYWQKLSDWGSLVPSKVFLTSAYRLSTFPLIHKNLTHAVVNVLALTPLMERFENEYGSLSTLALFFGPLTSLPALLYVLLEGTILRGNKPVMGAR